MDDEVSPVLQSMLPKPLGPCNVAELPWQMVWSGPMLMEHVGWPDKSVARSKAMTLAAITVGYVRRLFKRANGRVKIRATAFLHQATGQLVLHVAVNTRLMP